MGRLAKYVFSPGIVKEGTNYSNEGGWFDADKVRFRKGRPERIGGWEKQSNDAFIGTCRKIHTYRDIGQTNYTVCLLYTSPSPRDRTRSRMPSSA